MNIKGTRNLFDSPCIGLCSATNIGDEICIGCGRSKYEVDNWNSFSMEKKFEVNKRLKERGNHVYKQ